MSDITSIPLNKLVAWEGTAHADQFCGLDPLSLIPVIPFYAEIRETIETPARDRITL